MNLFYLFVILGIFASSCSQLLLKISADKHHKSWTASILNWRVIMAYVIIFVSLLINITALGNGIYVKDLPILESLGYVFVPFLSLVFLKERISRKTMLSMVLIIVGIFVFYL